jgi:Plasmid replication region DNA-binding N-term
MIRYEEVRDVVRGLIAEGLRPSRKRVRAAIGEGSYETLAPLIDQATAELGYQPPPLGLVENDDDPPDDAPAARYTPPDPDPAEVARHLDTLRTQAALVAAKSHLRSLCAVLRCLGPSLETITPSLTQQFRDALQAAGPTAALSMYRPAHQEPMDELTTAGPALLQAAEVLLSLLEKENTDGSRPAA